MRFGVEVDLLDPAHFGDFIEATVHVDTLHTLSRGVTKAFVHYALWACLEANIFGLGARLTDPELHATTCMMIKMELFSFLQICG